MQREWVTVYGLGALTTWMPIKSFRGGKTEERNLDIVGDNYGLSIEEKRLGGIVDLNIEL